MQFLGRKEVFDECRVNKDEGDLVTSVGDDNIVIKPGMLLVIKCIPILFLMIFLILNKHYLEGIIWIS
jgi:hypothetical protein